MLKTIGYLISTLSVLLLGLVAWQAAADDAFLRNCLLLGTATSVIGMFCRWLSFRLDERPHADRARSDRVPHLGHASADPRG